MPTLKAAKLLGDDFLGNHIGELLIRQPVKKVAAPPRNKTSSNASTVCDAESATIRRSSIASFVPQSVSSSASNSDKVRCAAAAIDSFLNVGAIASLGTSADPIASLEQSSESSSSEPSSVDSRSCSVDAGLHLHLDQLSLSHKRLASEATVKSPRVTFSTNFGAKLPRSGSRRAPSEAGSSSYFGMGSSNMSSHLSSASLSPMEPSDTINWNLPFRDQNQSFSQAVEHNALLSSASSQQSQSSGAASSQSFKLPATHSGLAVDATTPTNIGDQAVTSVKSQSFSASVSAQPVRHRLTRAATESTLEPSTQMMKESKSPGASSGLSQSNSMGASTAAIRTHRRKPSLVPTGDDERTFRFVDISSSEAGDEDTLVEEPEAPNTTRTSPTRTPSESAPKGAVTVQSNCNPHTSSAHLNTGADGTIGREVTAADTPQEQGGTSLALQSVVQKQDTPQPSFAPLKPLSLMCRNISRRPVRKLRIAPNVQSRPSLLEKTTEELRGSSRPPQTSYASGIPSEVEYPVVTPGAIEKVGQPPSPNSFSERYDPNAYGAEQRIFRIQSSVPTDGSHFPFTAIPTDDSGKASKRSEPPSSHARTSDWARAQNLLTSAPPVHEPSRGTSQHGFHDLQASLASLSGHDAVRRSATVNGAGNGLLPVPIASQSHTASHSSSSTDSPSLLDTHELLSPPSTAISTPELESPPEHALDSFKPVRRTSPLAA